MIAKMILSSGELGCSEEIITIAAVLSIQVSPINSLNTTEGFVHFSSLQLTIRIKFLKNNLNMHIYLGCTFVTINHIQFYRKYLNLYFVYECYLKRNLPFSTSQLKYSSCRLSGFRVGDRRRNWMKPS